MSVKQGGKIIAGASTTDTANKNLSNLNPQGQNIANWSTNVANCITEIPQDIKLELNNGTLTLKAGSKVYVPNGDGVFDAVTIASDLSTGNQDWSSGKGILYYRTDINAIATYPLDNTESGSSSTLTYTYRFWYDTTNNVIKTTSNSGSTWEQRGASLPIAIVHWTKSTYDVIDSIDQVFNGFGYIGSTVFALPNVKGLIPNGRNEDGGLKNNEFVNDRVRTFTASGSGYGLTYFLNPDITNLSVINTKAYAEKDTKLTTFDYNNGVWFDTKQNIMLLTADSGTTWTRVNYVSFSYMFMTNVGRLDYLVSKTPFHAVDTADLATKQDSATALTTTNTYYSGTTLYIG